MRRHWNKSNLLTSAGVLNLSLNMKDDAKGFHKNWPHVGCEAERVRSLNYRIHFLYIFMRWGSPHEMRCNALCIIYAFAYKLHEMTDRVLLTCMTQVTSALILACFDSDHVKPVPCNAFGRCNIATSEIRPFFSTSANFIFWKTFFKLIVHTSRTRPFLFSSAPHKYITMTTLFSCHAQARLVNPVQKHTRIATYTCTQVENISTVAGLRSTALLIKVGFHHWSTLSLRITM